MKNSQLHTLLHDLHGPNVNVPHAQANLRRTIVSAPKKRSLTARFGQRFRLHNDPFLRSKQRYVSMGTLVVALLFVGSFVTYTYRFSPKAAADQVIDQSLATLSDLPSSEFTIVQEQLGGDPAAELKTAKAAKNVHVITKQDFVALGKSATSMISMSLSSDPTAPKSGMVTVTATADGATMAKGTIRSIAGTSATSASAPGAESGSVSSNGDVVFISSGTVGTEPGGTPAIGAGVSSSGPTPLPADGPTTIVTGTDGTVTNMPTPAPGDSATFSTSGGASGTMSATPVAMSAQFNAKDMPTIKVVEPSTYLQYTDSKGRTVVLSLDAKGIPIYKTIFVLKK